MQCVPIFLYIWTKLRLVIDAGFPVDECFQPVRRYALVRIRKPVVRMTHTRRIRIAKQVLASETL